MFVTPPADVRAACCAGLNRRNEQRRGGTGPAVEFAELVCGGATVPDRMVAAASAALRQIEDRQADGDWTDDLRVAWDLWGGDAGMAWIDALTVRPAVVDPLLAAPRPGKGPAGRLARWSEQAAAVDRDLTLQLVTLTGAVMEAGLARVVSLAANRLRRPDREVLAALGGHADRDAVLDTMAGLPPVDQLAVIPRPVFARLGIAETDVFESTFATQLSPQADRMLTAAGEDAVALLEELGLDRAERTALEEEQAGHRKEALALLLLLMMQNAARLTAGSPLAVEGEPGEVPFGVVPPIVGLRTASRAGGGTGTAVADPHVTTPTGRLLVGHGPATGPTAVGHVEQVARTAPERLGGGPDPLTVVSTITWRHGRPRRAFPPHQALNGRSWNTDTERRDLAVKPAGEFPTGEGTWFPGDHPGCTCRYELSLSILNPGSTR